MTHFEPEISNYMISNSREIVLDGGINFRDIGGYQSRDGRRVKWRKILRSGHLSNLTDTDKKTLINIGVNQIHDFRRVEEQRRQPSIEFGAKTINDYRTEHQNHFQSESDVPLCHQDRQKITQ